METESFYQILILIGLLLLSAFFSGSEVAIFSIEEKKLKEKEKEGSLINRYLLSLINNPHRILVTILLSNTLVNVAASILGVAIAIEFANKYQYTLEIVLAVQITLLTIVILLFSEIIPKVFATKYPCKFASFSAIPLYWIAVLIYPISKIVIDFFGFITKKLKINKSKSALQEAEIAELASLSHEKGTIKEDEQDLIHGIVTFKTVTVKEVMTPRVDISAIPISEKYEDILLRITESGKSRLPLYEESLDNIIGIVYAKDLLRFLKTEDAEEILNINKIARQTYFVPENKLISELLKEFQDKNLHMGIVVDEYGGTSGLITLEDILEEIVGEIHDEFDYEEVEFKKISESSFIALGKISISDLNEELDSDFSSEEDEYETLGGFIFNYAGTIPEAGFSFIERNFKFTVKSIADRRINEVEIKRLEEKE